MEFRKHFGYDVEKASNEATLEGNGIESGESLTVQSMSEDADINVMMKRMGVTGRLPENPRVPSYGDFTGITDFRSAMAAVLEAEESFMEFPADVRAKFENDPQKLLEFVSVESNHAEAFKLGLVKEGPKAVPVVASAPVAPGVVTAPVAPAPVVP